MGRNARHGFLPGLTACLCGLLVGLFLGCARHEAPAPTAPVPDTPATPPPAPLVPPQVRTDHNAAYDKGLAAYDAGEWKKAAAAWREVLARETDPALRQKALFALAALKLGQAGNEADLATAMDLFDAWLKTAPPGGNGEDARLLAPVVHNFRPAFAVKKEVKAAGEKECGKRLSEREEQIRRMQQQVKALENIHREIQEKKKGLTSY